MKNKFFFFFLIVSFSFSFSQNGNITREGFEKMIFESTFSSEKELINLLNLSYKDHVTSLYSDKEMFANRINIYNRLCNGNFKDKRRYVNMTIDYFMTNKSMIDSNDIISWSTLVDIMYHVNKNKIYRDEIKDLFLLLLNIGDKLREKKISNSNVTLYDSKDLELAILSWGLANYFEFTENKKEALKHYKNSFNWIDIEKYYELWKNYLWEGLSKLFFLNTSLYFEMQKDRLIYLENAKEWLDLINNIDISDEKYIGARNTKNIVNRSYSFIIKDYETERIYIDKMINDFGKNFDLSLISLTNDYNLKKISKDNYKNELISLYDIWNRPYDARVEGYLTVDKKFQSRLKRYSSQFVSLDFFNRLSFQEQVAQYMNRFRNFMILKSDFISLPESSKIKYIKDFTDFIIKIENYSTNNKELFEKVNYDKIDNLFNERLKINTLIKSYNKIDANDFVLKLQKQEDRLKLLEQEIKKNLKFDEIKLDYIQASIKENQAVIRIIQDYNGEFMDYYCLIIKNNSIDFFNLNDAVDFDRVYNYYLNKLISKEIDDRSYNLFFEKIFKKLTDINEIYFINKGIYANINIESLKSSKGFVFDLIDIKYISSLLSVVDYKNIPSNFSNALLLGDPIFDFKKQNSSNNNPTRGGLYQLPATRKEIKLIDSILEKNQIKSISLLGKDATELKFKKNLKTDLIHIATHGFYKKSEEKEIPDFGLFFADSGNIKLNEVEADYFKNDNVLNRHELQFINLSRTKLVILSACETAVSFSSFLGNYNLSEEFIKSGAKNVISTLWKVDDNVTQKFMVIFYEMISKGFSIESSIKLTKQKIKEIYPNPYYWAPFVLIRS